MSRMHAYPRRRIGLIGHGRIGRALESAVAAGQAGAWDIVAVLSRHHPQSASATHHIDPDAFFRVPVDLVIECAGPLALAQFAERALRAADVWSVRAVALVDDALRARLERVGAASGHRLRLVAGAAGGLDAVQAIASHPGATVQVAITTPSGGEPVSGSVREASGKLPNGVNLAVAVALAGTGLDQTTVRITPDPERLHHEISVDARSAVGTFHGSLAPVTDASRDLHVVAASLVAALRQACGVIWVG